MSRLAEIIAYKRKEIEPWLVHTKDWGDRAAAHSYFRGFRRSLTSGSFGFIGEVKKASPSAGIIATDFDPIRTASAFNEAGANCISVLTDEKFFRCHLDYLALILQSVPNPLLRKDFILHEVQIYQAALAGADAVLLIVAALNDRELSYLMDAADDCGIDALVEVHDEPELKRALAAGAALIGINNRTLATSHVDLRTTDRLAPLIPNGHVVISESGIRSVEDIRRVDRAGVYGALFGYPPMSTQH